MTIKKANEITGGLTATSKMPCRSYSLPTTSCNNGTKLRRVKRSVCSHCYAHERGNYKKYAKNIIPAQNRRLRSLRNPRWVSAMVELIYHYESQSGYFRWHDSGDIQGMWHLKKIVAVAKRLPHIKFWLPTKEYGIVLHYTKQYGDFPDNLTVRVSTPLIHKRPLRGFKNTATVGVNIGFHCHSYDDKNTPATCGSCRACWDKEKENIDGTLH